MSEPFARCASFAPPARDPFAIASLAPPACAASLLPSKREPFAGWAPRLSFAPEPLVRRASGLASLALAFAYAEVASTNPTLPAPRSISVPTLPVPSTVSVPTLPAPRSSRPTLPAPSSAPAPARAREAAR